jgi:RNA polymerase sigma-70 factor (sigma-E family)
MGRGTRATPPDDLAAFYVDQFDRVRGSLALVTGDRQLGEELAQEAFVRVCQHWERVRTMDAPGAWVHRVGINLAISRGRRTRSEGRAHRRLRAERPVDQIASDGADDSLRAALLGLGLDERSVVVLRFYADLSVTQVAGVLGIPEGTVKTRTRTGLAALRAAGLVAPDDEADVTEEVR